MNRRFKLCNDLSDNLYKDELSGIAVKLGLKPGNMNKAGLCRLISNHVKGDYKLLEQKLGSEKQPFPYFEDVEMNDEDRDAEQRYEKSNLPNLSDNMRWINLTLNDDDFSNIFKQGDLPLLKVLLFRRPDLRMIIFTKAFPLFLSYYNNPKHLELAQYLYDLGVLPDDLYLSQTLNSVKDDTNYLAWAISNSTYPDNACINRFFESSGLVRKPNVANFLLNLKLWPSQDSLDRMLDFDTVKYFLGKGMSLSSQGISNIIIHGSPALIALILQLGYRPKQQDIDHVPLMSRNDNDSIEIYEILRKYDLHPSLQVLSQLRSQQIRNPWEDRNKLLNYLSKRVGILEDLRQKKAEEAAERLKKEKKKETKEKKKKAQESKKTSNDYDDDYLEEEQHDDDENSESMDSEELEARTKAQKEAEQEANEDEEEKKERKRKEKEKEQNDREDAEDEARRTGRDWTRFFSYRKNRESSSKSSSSSDRSRRGFESFEDFLNNESQGIQQFSPACLACAQVLDKEGLWPTSKPFRKLTDAQRTQLAKGFRQWALVNHPDKQPGNEGLFQVVSNCNDIFKVKGKC